MKKILVILLALVLLIAPLSITASAAKTPTFVISTGEGKAGDTVDITVSTKNNSGIISMKLLLKYDSRALKIEAVKGGAFSGVAFSPNESNPFIVNWINSINPNNKTNGTVATITFKILDTAPNGKSEITLDYDPENVFDSNLNNVTFQKQNGYIDITNENAPVQNNNSSQDSALQDGSSQDNSSQNTSSDVMIDTTNSTILNQIQNSQNQGNTNPPKDNGWIIWVVVGAIVVLIGGFAVVIIKGKREK